VRAVDINTADLDASQAIPHIGPERAREIMVMRPLDRIDQLTALDGIGPERLQDIREYGGSSRMDRIENAPVFPNTYPLPGTCVAVRDPRRQIRIPTGLAEVEQMKGFGHMEFAADILQKHGLPEMEDPDRMGAMEDAIARADELPFAELLFGLQQKSSHGDCCWTALQPAMARLAELIVPEDDREQVAAGGDKWWIEIGPVDLEGTIVTIQRSDRLLAAIAPRADGRLCVSAFRALDGCHRQPRCVPRNTALSISRAPSGPDSNNRSGDTYPDSGAVAGSTPGKAGLRQGGFITICLKGIFRGFEYLERCKAFGMRLRRSPERWPDVPPFLHPNWLESRGASTFKVGQTSRGARWSVTVGPNWRRHRLSPAGKHFSTLRVCEYGHAWGGAKSVTTTASG